MVVTWCTWVMMWNACMLRAMRIGLVVGSNYIVVYHKSNTILLYVKRSHQFKKVAKSFRNCNFYPASILSYEYNHMAIYMIFLNNMILR
jgi:hypothetical protein